MGMREGGGADATHLHMLSKLIRSPPGTPIRLTLPPPYTLRFPQSICAVGIVVCCADIFTGKAGSEAPAGSPRLGGSMTPGETLSIAAEFFFLLAFCLEWKERRNRLGGTHVDGCNTWPGCGLAVQTRGADYIHRFVRRQHGCSRDSATRLELGAITTATTRLHTRR